MHSRGVGWALIFGVVASCATQLPCSTQCDGCCDPEGLCIPATDTTCGSKGQTCIACEAPNRCFAGECAAEPFLTTLNLTWSIEGVPCAASTAREGAVRFQAGVPPDLFDLDCTAATTQLRISLPPNEARPFHVNGLDPAGRIVLAARSQIRAENRNINLSIGPSNGATARVRLALAPFEERDGQLFCDWLGISEIEWQLRPPSGTSSALSIPCVGTRELDAVPGTYGLILNSPYFDPITSGGGFLVLEVGRSTSQTLSPRHRVSGVAADWKFSAAFDTDCATTPISSLHLTSMDPTVGFDASVPCAPLRSNRFVADWYFVDALATLDGGTRRYEGTCMLGDRTGRAVDLDAGTLQICQLWAR